MTAARALLIPALVLRAGSHQEPQQLNALCLCLLPLLLLASRLAFVYDPRETLPCRLPAPCTSISMSVSVSASAKE